MSNRLKQLMGTSHFRVFFNYCLKDLSFNKTKKKKKKVKIFILVYRSFFHDVDTFLFSALLKIFIFVTFL